MADQECEVELLQDLLGDHGRVPRLRLGIVGVWSRRGIAIGNIAVGSIAVRSMTIGSMAVGSMAVGSVAVGNVTVGAIAVGGGNAIGNAVRNAVRNSAIGADAALGRAS